MTCQHAWNFFARGWGAVGIMISARLFYLIALMALTAKRLFPSSFRCIRLPNLSVLEALMRNCSQGL